MASMPTPHGPPRHVLKLMTAGFLAAGMSVGKASPHIEASFQNPAIKALDQLLKDRDNKVVITFWNHDDAEQQKFNLESGLLPMLQQRGFTDNYVEQPPENQKYLDQSTHSYPAAASFQSYYALEAYHAARNGIKSTAVDVGFGIDPPSTAKVLEADHELHQYYGLLDQAWLNHVVKDGIDLSKMSSGQKVDEEALYLRAYMKTADGKYLTELAYNMRAASDVTYAREDDQPTGERVAQLVNKAKGRVWMNYGNAHFTPCGIQTYVKDPLVLSIYPDQETLDIDQAMKRNNDIFIGAHFGPASTESHALLIKEGKVVTVPKADASATAPEACHSLDRMVRQVLSSVHPHP